MNIQSTRNSVKIIRKAIHALGVKDSLRTEPKLIKEILKEFELDSFETQNVVITKWIKDATTKPQPLKPMLDNIKQGILDKHPALIEFAEVCLKNGWLSKSDKVIKALNVAYILEGLTVGMSNSHSFFLEMYQHYSENERKIGLDRNHLVKAFVNSMRISRSWFLTAKAFSVDPTTIYFLLQRGFPDSKIPDNELKEMLRKRQINYFAYRLLKHTRKRNLTPCNEILRINIYEAGITEYQKGIQSNAECAHELSEDVKICNPKNKFKNKNILPENAKQRFYNEIVEKQNIFPTVGVSQEWVSLYVSWNMAFLLLDLDNLDIVFPKLIIPSVINCKSEDFLGVRVISLWLTINHSSFIMDRVREPGPKNKYEMVRAWGEINRKYAIKLAKNHTGESKRVFYRRFHKFYTHPLVSYFRLVREYLFK